MGIVNRTPDSFFDQGRYFDMDASLKLAEQLVADVCRFLVDRAERAATAGIPADRVVLDAGLGLGKTWEQSLELLRASDRLAALGYPLLLSASNKTFLGRFLELEIDDRNEASL